MDWRGGAARGWSVLSRASVVAWIWTVLVGLGVGGVVTAVVGFSTSFAWPWYALTFGIVAIGAALVARRLFVQRPVLPAPTGPEPEPSGDALPPISVGALRRLRDEGESIFAKMPTGLHRPADELRYEYTHWESAVIAALWGDRELTRSFMEPMPINLKLRVGSLALHGGFARGEVRVMIERLDSAIRELDSR